MMHKIKSALFVGTDTDLADIVSKFLNRIGFAVEVAFSADEAFVKIKETPLDLLITDLNDHGEKEIVRAVKGSNLVTPVIMIKDFSFTDTNEGAKIEGTSYYLRKPFSMEEMISAVNKLIIPKAIM